MVDVTMYCTATCPYCSHAELLLKSKGVEVHKIRVDLDAAQRVALMEKTGRRTVPQVYIGSRHVGGFEELRALDQTGELDTLLGIERAAPSA